MLMALALTAAMAGAADGASPPQSEPNSAQEPSSAKPAMPSRGVDSYQGLPVGEITFPNIASEAERQRLLNLIPQHVGEALDRELIRKSIQALFATGRFADIEAEGEHTSEGKVRLEFFTSPNYFIGEVRVEGNPNRPSASQVANSSKLQLGEPFTTDKLERAVNNIQQLLEENGYYRASVEDEVIKHPETQQAEFVFRIHSGPQAHVGQVRVTGNPGYSAEEVQEIAHLHPSDPVSSQHMSDALDRLRKKYQKKKFWLAQATVAEHTYRPAANAVDYTLDIDPGPKVDIVTEGFHISRGVLRKNVPVYQENALDDDLLNEGRRNLLNYLESRGYFEAKVSVNKKSEATGKEMLVIYDIDAGERHKLLKVAITGNHYFSEEQLRAVMQVQPAGRLLSHGLFTECEQHSELIPGKRFPAGQSDQRGN
jgi:outer membrane protein insertion porin family